MRNLLLASILVFTSSCFVHTRSAPGNRSSSRKACPPSTHWDDGECVHNGKAKGHNKH